jgi:hypothetical protein
VTDQSKTEVYMPPTLTVIGSLATDTHGEIIYTVTSEKSPNGDFISPR